MFKRIDHISFNVRDRAKSVQFYEEHFGFKKYYENNDNAPTIEKIVHLKLGNTILELVHMSTESTTGSTNRNFHFCLESDSFDEDYNRLKDAVVPVNTESCPAEEREPREKGWRKVVFIGPDGELIEFRG